MVLWRGYGSVMSTPAVRTDRPPNILLITSDQQHYDTLGVSNSRIQTPALDRLCTYVDERYKITVYREGDDGELFDLVNDPGEVTNLWQDPDAGAVKQELLHRFLQATLAAEPTRMPRIAGA